MTIQVTPCDVKTFCTTSLGDQAIEALICVVQSKMGECVEAAYDECVGKQVLIYAVCHMVESQSGEKTQVRAANGASVSKQYHGTGEGVKSTQAGRMLIMIDSAGCYNNLFASPLLFGTVGEAARGTPDTGFYS
tara:strand:- start:300 stop:701 length:402 start_codon:yes stop_codon:yes gene_type:complete